MSTLSALQSWLGACASKTLRREHPLVIAVTGVVGKSTAKQAIAAILNADNLASKTRVSAKNYNNELGIPLTVFGLPAPGRSPFAWLRLVTTAFLTASGFRQTGIGTFVFEMGADKPGDLAYLTKLAPPDIAVVTAVAPEGQELTPVHAANYPSIDAVVEEKGTIVKAMRSGGTAILNADDASVFAMRHLTANHSVTFGETDAADVRLTGHRIVMEAGERGAVPTGLELTVQCFNRHQTVFLPGVYGRPIAYAVCAAMAVADALDIELDVAQRLTQNFKPLAGRTRIIPGIKQTTLLDDTYNASPAAVLSSLRDLSELALNEDQRRVACLGEMRELGETSEAMHRAVGAEVAKRGIDLLVCCGTFAVAMADGARANGMREEQVRIVNDTPEAGLFLQDWIKPGDVILAKASEGRIDSKGVRMERVIKELMAEPLRANEFLCRQEAAWSRV